MHDTRYASRPLRQGLCALCVENPFASDLHGKIIDPAQGAYRSSVFFSRQRLEIVLLEVLDPAEEPILRFGNCAAVQQFRLRELQCADHVGGLEKPVSGGSDVLGELDFRRVDHKRLFQDFRNLRLSVVVIDFDSLVRVEVVAMCDQKVNDLLKECVVQGAFA